TPRERLTDAAFRRLLPASWSRFALLRVSLDVVPFSGGGRSTPARRAFESPMAIACSVERAPCLPSRTCSISSRTNSPACVLGALPCRFALCARSIVFFSGIILLLAISSSRHRGPPRLRRGRPERPGGLGGLPRPP